ncbi:hypothetical protein [Methanocella sp. MCL-LM]|uniref:hypothetical protein n=1 Tax=Methanocella sp. MCL-LM TaxID=3412035 RepID=UPI003C750300
MISGRQQTARAKANSGSTAGIGAGAGLVVAEETVGEAAEAGFSVGAGDGLTGPGVAVVCGSTDCA